MWWSQIVDVEVVSRVGTLPARYLTVYRTFNLAELVIDASTREEWTAAAFAVSRS